MARPAVFFYNYFTSMVGLLKKVLIIPKYEVITPFMWAVKLTLDPTSLQLNHFTTLYASLYK